MRSRLNWTLACAIGCFVAVASEVFWPGPSAGLLILLNTVACVLLAYASGVEAATRKVKRIDARLDDNERELRRLTEHIYSQHITGVGGADVTLQIPLQGGVLPPPEKLQIEAARIARMIARQMPRLVETAPVAQGKDRWN